MNRHSWTKHPPKKINNETSQTLNQEKNMDNLQMSSDQRVVESIDLEQGMNTSDRWA